MQCERCREWILTDYLDEEMDAVSRQQLEQHLKVCIECREYESLARKAAVAPFRDAEQIMPPEYLWNRIQATIEAVENESAGAWFWDMVESIKRFSRPIIVGCSLFIVAFAITKLHISGPASQTQVTNSIVEEPYEVYAYLTNGDFGPEFDSSFGTEIEEYFL